MVASYFIPITTLVMTRNGVTPFIYSLDEVESINGQVDSVAFQGVAIAESLSEEREKLRANFTRQTLSMEHVCPNLPAAQQPQNESTSLLSVAVDTVSQYILAGLTEVDTFVDSHAPQAHIALSNAVGFAERVDHAIEWTYDNDWALKFFLLTINVVNGFFIFGVFLTKQDIVSNQYQRFLSLGIIPLFFLLLLCSLLIACAFGVASMLNADFCHGSRSTTGFIAETLSERGTATANISYQAFLQYIEGCLDESPLDYLHKLDSSIQQTMSAVNLLEETFDSYTSQQMNYYCADDAHVPLSRLPQLRNLLREIQFQIRRTIELTDCQKISPILRRILHGATCSQTMDALTWIFGGMCVITILGFIMLTTRAGLFNAVAKAPRRKRRREREKEFEEYKEYMAEYYEDADDWNIDFPTKTGKACSAKGDILRAQTFETDGTSKSMGPHGDDDCGSDAAYFSSPSQILTHSDDDDQSDDGNAYLNENNNDDEVSESCDYSFESDYSSGSEENQSSAMSASIIGRFFRTRERNDDAHASFLGMSLFSSTNDNRSQLRSHVGILELQTPRRRRKQSLQPALYATFADRSPDYSLSPNRGVSPTTKKIGVLLTPRVKPATKEF